MSVDFEMWESDRDEAAALWRVVQETTLPCYNNHGGEFGEIRFVRADAGTGTNYVVITTPLDPAAKAETGGPVLVVVYSPWQDVWAMQRDNEDHSNVVAASYVAEHLCQGRRSKKTLHGGDLAAITLTVAHALGRQSKLDG